MKGRELFVYHKFMGIVCSVFLVLLFLNAVSASGEGVRGVSSDFIKIGIITDLTGPISDSSIPYSKGAETYLRHISDQGGIHGRKIKTIKEDDRYSIPSGIAAFKKLVFKDKVLACIGPESPMSVALMSQIEKYRVPMIVYSEMSIMTDPLKRYIFPPVGSFRAQSILLVDYAVRDLGAKDARIGFLVAAGAYYTEFLTAVQDAARFHGVKVVAEGVLDVGAIDATSQVLAMKRAGANFMFIANSVGANVALLKDSKRYGYQPTFLGIDPVCADKIIGLTGKACENLIAAHGFASWYEDSPSLKKMRKTTLQYYPKTKHQPRHYTWGWVSSMVLAEGLKNAGKDLTIDGLVKGLEKMSNFDTGGLSSPITFTSTDHRGGRYYKLNKPDFEKGYFVPVTDWRKPSIR